MSVPTWGYRKGESRIFDLPAGGKLPPGWYDSPAKIPDGNPGQGGAPAVADLPPAPQVAPPPPSIRVQEMRELQRLLAEAVAETTGLKARVLELEAELTAVHQPFVEAAEGLPPPPAGAQPPIGEILSKVDAADGGQSMTPIEKARAAKAAKRERDKDPPA